ncbi:MAG: DUF924 family protein [Candidatus Nucleicultricaceae bacterium]|jgi:uncharacterized protein (DUF924 family)
MVDVDKILDFWFGSKTEPKYQSFWFGGRDAYDALITEMFRPMYDQAQRLDLEPLKQDPFGSLTLVLLFDQFPRHFFRKSPQMFSTDALALSIARASVDQKQDHALPNVMRAFLYLPFEHSEVLEDQKDSVELFSQLKDEVMLSYALSHYRTIEKFGRFPHRNAMLGRQSSAEEAAFLENPPSGFFAG